MELELSRIDYAIVGITSRNCMKLLPSSGRHEQQRIAVADGDGILQVFSIKKGDIQLHFKTLPGAKITSLQLGGAAGTPSDKIFISSDNEVRGYTRKGKLFLSFDSNMTEPIKSMFIMGSDLFLCGNHVYNHYKDCKDVGSYLCGDCIVDILAVHSDKVHRLVALIACEGRMIRALEHARVTMTMEVESSPTVLHLLQQNGQKNVIFGTVDGRIGLLDIESLKSFQRWILNNETYSSSVSCIETYDLTGDGIKNLVLGRQDGNIEIYSFNIDDLKDTPTLIYFLNCIESVSSIQCGIIGSPNCEEVLVLTYTGKIFGLTTQTVEPTGIESLSGSYMINQDTGQRINKLKNEIEELQVKVLKEREKYQTSTQSYLDEMSAIPLLSIKDSMILSKEDVSYTLTLEVPAPIDNILLQSDVPISLLDVDKNSAVVSYSDPELQKGNYLLATYRCQINTNRLELKIRTIEGQYGILQAYITPLIHPKCCQVKQYEIKPLSLHYRIYKIDETRPFNVLTFKGNFSLAEIHCWVHQSLPEVPEKPQFTERTFLYFQSAFLDSILICSFTKGDAEFKSDNPSTISILKDFLTKEATKKKIKIDINISVNDKSIPHLLQLIDPKLVYYVDLNTKMSIIEALEDLGIDNEDALQCLSAKYRELINSEKEIRDLISKRPSYLDRLYGIVTDLFIDYYKLKGITVKSKVPKLLEILNNYNYSALINFFIPE